MKVERVFPRVVVVQYNVHSVAFFQDEGVRVGAIDHRIHGSVASCQHGVERGHLRHDIRDVIEKGALRIFVSMEVMDRTPACAGTLTSLHRRRG